MNSYFNNFPIDLNEVAIPRSVNMDMGLKSVDKFIKYLWNIIQNEDTNRRLYYKLMDKGLNTPILMRNQSIEILPGKFIKIYLVLVDSTDPTLAFSSKGSYRNNSSSLDIFKEGWSLRIFLPVDIEEDLILWDDELPAVLDHEITHVYQHLDAAIRYLRFKNRFNPKYKVNYDEVMKILNIVNLKGGKRNFQKYANLQNDINVYISYLSSREEMGARATALLRQLAKDKDLLREILHYCEIGQPSFEIVNKKLDKKSLHGWSELNQLCQSEIKVLNIREEDTVGYFLKKQLLNTLYDLFITMTEE